MYAVHDNLFVMSVASHHAARATKASVARFATLISSHSSTESGARMRHGTDARKEATMPLRYRGDVCATSVTENATFWKFAHMQVAMESTVHQ